MSSIIVKGTLKVFNTSLQENDTLETTVNTNDEKNKADSSKENKTEEKNDNKEPSQTNEKNNASSIDKNNDDQLQTKPTQDEDNKSNEIKENSSNSSSSGSSSTKPKDEQKPWEAVGKTENQYYNEPMFSWERVDFGTMQECLSYGEKYELYLNGEVLYNCRDVLSASGKHLGIMFETEKLN